MRPVGLLALYRHRRPVSTLRTESGDPMTCGHSIHHDCPRCGGRHCLRCFPGGCEPKPRPTACDICGRLAAGPPLSFCDHCHRDCCEHHLNAEGLCERCRLEIERQKEWEAGNGP